jgi:L-threonylcarbamoyladenylate synthase
MALHLPVGQESSFDRPLMVAAEVIQAGGLVVYPTDTLYGIGANPWHRDAVLRVQAVKGREDSKPLLVLAHSVEAALALATGVTPAARSLMEKFWPGPLTLVMQAAPAAPPSVVAANGTVGIRVPDHRISRRLAELSGVPLISTSANRSGTAAGTTVREIERDLGSGIDLFLDGGPLTGGVPSTMIDVSSGSPRLIREGALSVSDIVRAMPRIGL